MKLHSRDLALLRASLVFVWLATSLVSVVELNGQSRDLLNAAGIADPTWVRALVMGGAGLDAALGVALWLRPSRRVCLAALLLMLLMTLAATVLIPDLWLHPLGPLTKNLPLAAMLWVLIRHAR
jgi:hypothetical protein